MCEPTRSDTSSDTLFLRRDPAAASKVFDLLLPNTFCHSNAKSLRMLCTAWLAVMWYTALLEMLVFPIRCQRLKQCHHNLRLLEESRRCASARVMCPIFIFLCCVCNSGTRWSTTRDTENLACTSVGIWLVFYYTLGDPLVCASTESRIWRNLSNEKRCCSQRSNHRRRCCRPPHPNLSVCRSASMYFRGIWNDASRGTYG